MSCSFIVVRKTSVEVGVNERNNVLLTKTRLLSDIFVHNLGFDKLRQATEGRMLT